jgi:hypothetical protein
MSQKFVLVYVVGQMFFTLRDEFAYFVYICQSDMFLAAGFLYCALL